MERTTSTEKGSTLSQPYEPTWALVWQEFHRACRALGYAPGPRRRANQELTAALERRQRPSVGGRSPRR